MPSEEIQQLQTQQQLLTLSLKAMLEGDWCGEPPSVQAFVDALDPDLNPQCVPPYRHSDQPAPPPGFLALYDPSEGMPPQTAAWTCSSCSLAWIERALAINDHADEWSATDEIGMPEHVNPTYGLMDGSGARLMHVLADDYGQSSRQSWGLTFDQAYSIYSQSPGMASGATWYHWIAVRGVIDGSLWIANSAPGYGSVWDVLTREDWGRLGGWSCIWLV
jgi:hypothetical protein